MKKNLFLVIVSLFTSVGTLLCCALPALLVTLGMGAVMAGLVSNVPELIWLSQHKGILFAIAAALLVISGIFIYRSKYLPCPADPEQAKICTKLRQLSKWIYIASCFIYIIGFFFAFIAEKIFF